MMGKLENKDVVVKKARNGRGVFAKRKFYPDEIVFEVKGEFLTCDADEDLDEEERNNTYRYDENLYISPGNTIPNFLNHSCDPNAKVIKKNKKLFVSTIREIPKGEEILFDYSTILADDDIWQMKCNCGSPSCRRTVKKFNSLPKKIKEKYISLGIVPDYILDI